ncbi:hypothetical protein MML48_2g00000902 [Holotrichia oblita]|uniref:Uncharacterized protein n=1 Tax=Holotrichia oblita TaxID=644536 RepID=A0ACB9TML0_HOLOL|nr:hypothetical protein MML48_2g00000902 [Holotrichia oblita]
MDDKSHVLQVSFFWPAQRETVKREFRKTAEIDGIVGAIDGTFIAIKVPQHDAEAYITRKCQYAITLPAICDVSMKFIDCYVGYPGSISGCRIFHNSDIYQRITNNRAEYLDEGEFIFGDKAYPLLSWCMIPYVDRGNLNAAQKNFNRKVSQTCQVIERSFAVLFGWFRRLKYLDVNKPEFIPSTVLGACVLHNMCLQNNEDIRHLVEEGLANVEGNEIVDPPRKNAPTDCKDCNKCYIGQTKQYLKKRIYDHQYTVTHNVTAETALSKHSKDRRHNFDFQNTKILKKENNYKKRLIYEMIYIKKDENAVNFRTDIDNLSVIYNNLIHA